MNGIVVRELMQRLIATFMQKKSLNLTGRIKSKLLQITSKITQ